MDCAVVAIPEQPANIAIAILILSAVVLFEYGIVFEVPFIGTYGG